MNKNFVIKILVGCIFIFGIYLIVFSRNINESIQNPVVQTFSPIAINVTSTAPAVNVVTTAPKIFNKIKTPVFVGPRGNAPSGTPKEYGFWSFAILDSGKISRSGQPLRSEFKWLKNNGWKAVVDLRFDGEYNEISDDSKIPGFNELNFKYLYLPIRDGAAPTIAQAKSFLKFVTDPENQPVHVHCRGGFGRAGTLIALYRHEIDGWTMRDAIAESRLFRDGVDSTQEKWLVNWEKNNKK